MRSNYSREERQKIVEEYIYSGKSQTVLAPEYGIKPNTLSWVTKYKSPEASQTADVHFVELKSTFIKENQNLIIRRLYVRPGSTDLRKGVTGLLAIIQNEMHLDASSNSVFFFCNKSHKLLKIIFWNRI